MNSKLRKRLGGEGYFFKSILSPDPVYTSASSLPVAWSHERTHLFLPHHTSECRLLMQNLFAFLKLLQDRILTTCSCAMEYGAADLISAGEMSVCSSNSSVSGLLYSFTILFLLHPFLCARMAFEEQERRDRELAERLAQVSGTNLLYRLSSLLAEPVFHIAFSLEEHSYWISFLQLVGLFCFYVSTS